MEEVEHEVRATISYFLKIILSKSKDISISSCECQKDILYRFLRIWCNTYFLL